MRFHHLLLLVFVVALGVSHYLGYTPIALGALFLVASLIAYSLYARDKAAARVGSWRVSENTLHVAALLFGWPGALVAQQRLRHKTRKQSFRVVFWFTVLVNLGGIAWVHSLQGNQQLRVHVHQLERLVHSSVPYSVPASVVLFLTEFRREDAAGLH